MSFAVTLGRFLLGLYFFLPGISKVTGYTDTLSYMALHNIPAPELLLPITIVLQIGGGVMLIIGIRVSQVALMFAGMTLIINVGMHDFWNAYEGVSQAYETQNLVTNLAIFAGLLVLGGTSQDSTDT